MRNTIIQNCKKYLGKPYVWGGESDSEGGYDCSGYAYNVLRDSGFKVNRTTAQGYSKLGTTIAYKNAQYGDLLFFGKSTSKITHIAIYAGNGKMYESIGGSENTKYNPGKGITLSNVSRRKDLILVKSIVNSGVENSTINTVVSRSWLQKGDEGQKVTDMQVMLIAIGYSCGSKGADGNFGTSTYNALVKFQKANGLKVDGLYGEKSKTMLEAKYTEQKNKTVVSNIGYLVGKSYTLQVELKVRKGAGTKYSAKKHLDLTRDGQKHDTDGDGALDKGTQVTCKAVKKDSYGNTWIKTPSGWIAAIYNGKIYVK